MENRQTHHCRIRLQQRSIPFEILDFIQNYGTSIRSHGADRYFLDKIGRQQLQQELRGSPDRKRYDRCANVYVVISDTGALITAGHRKRRFKRKS